MRKHVAKVIASEPVQVAIPKLIEAVAVVLLLGMITVWVALRSHA